MINRIFISLIILIIAIAAIFGMIIARNSAGVNNVPVFVPSAAPAPVDASRVVINGVIIPVEIADTPEERSRGLSGRTSLDAEKGMLFVFENPDTYQFWMPDMHFPIDIIWIENERVVDIDEQVSNQFDPKKPKYYSPQVPVRYVLEINAGFAKELGITKGNSVQLIIP